MGCGSSSLKGDAVADIGAEQPVRRVKTNFSTVDYDQDAKHRRMTEYAPHESVRQASTAIKEDAEKAPGSSDGQLKPYQTLSEIERGDSNIAQSSHTRAPHGTNTETITEDVDPTNAESKDRFATSNDPMHGLDGHDPESSKAGNESNDRKKSWFGQKYSEYQDKKMGRDKSFSDEELQKYTGMDQNEMNQWAKQTPGVAGNQLAGSLTAGPTTVASGDIYQPIKY